MTLNNLKRIFTFLLSSICLNFSFACPQDKNSCSAINSTKKDMPQFETIVVSKPSAKRIIYFTGHKDEPNSALITQVCKDCETFTAILQGECATRTLLNLYNLHAVRGVIGSDGRLCFKTSMSGPHHYFGWLDPKKHHTIKFEKDIPVYRMHPTDQAYPAAKKLTVVPDSYVLKTTNYDWINGSTIDSETRKLYTLGSEGATPLINTDSGVADSLFDNPGILALETEELSFLIIQDAHRYDLSSYRARIVPNDAPFAFDQDLVSQYTHAQHKLRIVTYNYGDRYLNDYLMRGSGVFIERHEFIQAITPMNSQCGGFVILGREIVESTHKVLELIAVTVPFGYTLLIDVGSIHGDSTLTGMYAMAMTGNHNAMKTADTVFMKNRTTLRNVAIKTIPSLMPIAGLAGNKFLLTSDEKSLAELIIDDQKIKSQITDSLNGITARFWLPVITTGIPSLGWEKTLGTSLPKTYPK